MITKKPNTQNFATLNSEKPIQTTIFAYWFDISKPEEKQGYEVLVHSLKAQGLIVFDTINSKHYLGSFAQSGVSVNLSVKNVFGDQWNTEADNADGLKNMRVFDWAETIYPNKHIKAGHYLIQTDEMKALRAHVFTCGFCGKAHDSREQDIPEFHADCLESRYLAENQLFLTRFKPVTARRNSEKQNALDNADLLKDYKLAQIKTGIELRKKERERLIRNKQESDRLSDIEYRGKLLLSDAGLSLDNVIFYKHTETFTVGWLKELTTQQFNEVQTCLDSSEVPFPYKLEIKAESGTLKTFPQNQE
jgi:hypothetical protein